MNEVVAQRIYQLKTPVMRRCGDKSTDVYCVKAGTVLGLAVKVQKFIKTVRGKGLLE
jgi:hypothetical protein